MVYAEKFDLCKGEEYEYIAAAQRCEHQKCDSGIRVEDFAPVKPKDHLALMLAVNEQPVSVLVCASSWQFYKKGIHKRFCGECSDHAVLLIGYGSDEGEDYWLIKNSWGPKWGEEGTIRIGRKRVDKVDGDYCGVAMGPYIPFTN